VHTIELIKVIRREGDRRYISEVNSWGLDSLLKTPNCRTRWRGQLSDPYDLIRIPGRR